jgi:hypothetical protein
MFRQMHPAANPERRQLEWAVLRLACSRFGSHQTEEDQGLAALTEAQFLDPVHRAIFREIAFCRGRGFSRDELRRRLPEVLTRLGWPDLDFDALFQDFPDALTAPELAELLRKLLEPADAGRGTS